MALRRLYNGLRAALGATLSSGATAITFPSALTSAGTNVPTLAGGDYIPLAILDPSTGNLTEIVHLTAYVSGATTGTIARAKAGTSATAHPAGAIVVCAPLVDDVAYPAWIAFPYAANWADVGSGWQAGRYRLLPGLNKVRVEFYAVRSSTNSGVDAIIGTLPAGFRPLALQVLGALQASGGVYAVDGIYINSSGQIITKNTVLVAGSVPLFAEFFID